MRRLATYCLTLFFLASCYLQPVSESTVATTVVPTRTLSLQDVESTEESSQESLIPTLAPIPSLTETSNDADCRPPDDWFEYTVARGDSLTRIAQVTNSTVDELIAANCLDNPNRIRVGDTILVPNEPE